MRDAFLWKPSVGPVEERPGHWNGPWEYWSTDGEPGLCAWPSHHNQRITALLCAQR